MTPDYDQLAEIVAAAEELNGEARERYLNESCPPAWRAEVDSLLHAGDRGRDAFEKKASALGEILTAFRGEQLTGQTVGPYLLEALLGTGGMGVVYRGRHRQTGQIAAVKILAAQTGDAAWQARFERETRTLQSIRHENVVRLLDAGEDDVYRYLAMEFVPGQSLRERCPRHWRDAAAIGRQLAAALQTVHAAGVVHRDLKPENVMLTKDGRAVLIDFGLARKDEKLNASVNSISGTFGYFSPEQVRGEPATGRSDVFALGALLYEMATGDRAFHGSSPLTTAAAILSGKLPPLPGHVPVELVSLIRRCLQQDAARRPTATEVETQLARLADTAKPPTLARQRWTRGALATAAVAAAAFAGWTAWLNTPPAPLFRRPIPTPGLQVFEPALAWHGDWLAFTAPGEGAALQAWITPARRWQPKQVTLDPAGVSEPALSPDGSRLAFCAAREPAGIYVRDLATNHERLLVSGGRSPRFSPDGRWIAYWTGRRDAVDVIRTGPTHAFIISAEGGTPEPVAPHLNEAHHPIWAPDSQQLAFSRAGSLYTWDRRARQTQARYSRSERPIAWRSTFGRDEVLSLTSGRMLSLALAAGMEAPLTAPGEKGITATLDRSGRMLLADETAVEGIWSLALHQPGATPTPILRGGGNYEAPRLSPDGRYLSYSVGNPPQPELRDLVSGRVTTGRPDTLFTPSGRAVKVPTTQGVVWDLSPQGDALLHACHPPNQNRSICLLKNGQDRLLLHHPKLHLYLACFSPDLSRVVFTGEADHAPPQIFLAPSSGAPSDQWQLLGSGDYPRFLPDGSLAFLHKTKNGHPALFQMAIGRPPVLLYEFTQTSPSPRLLRPGFFRLAAARHRLVFPLGEREGRLHEAEQISSAHVSPFPPTSPVNGTGVSLLSKINLLSRSALFSAFALFGAAGSVPGAIVYTATGPASWGASDATIGVAGLSIYGFETTQLPAGVSIRFTRGDNAVQTYDTGFGGTLPFVFDSSQDSFGTAFRLASAGDTNNATAHAWDGTRSLVNVPAQPITSYLAGFGWGTIRITFETPVSTVGFSLQQANVANTLNVMTNGGLTTTTTTAAGLTQDGFRNGYLRIDGTAGTTINYVELVNVSGDGFAIDHLAFSAQNTGGAVPEPGSALLVLAPLAGGWLWHRRRQRS